MKNKEKKSLKKNKVEKIEKTESHIKANEIIRKHVVWAMSAGAIPIPIIDAVGVTAIQLDMLRQLCDLYGVDYYKNQGKNLISAIGGGTISRGAASLIKTIPGIGSFFGVAAMSTMSATTTYALGRVFVSKFEKGVTLIDFNLTKNNEIFEEAYEKGKEYIEGLKK